MYNSELNKELIAEFSKLVDNPAMLAIRDKLSEMLESIPKSPTYYAQHENHSHVFSGYEAAIEEINNFIFNYMQYATEDQVESGEDSETSYNPPTHAV